MAAVFFDSIENHYQLYRRKVKSGHIYYVKFRLPNGQFSSGKSTGTSNRDKAVRFAEESLKEDSFINHGGTSLWRYARDFFNWDGKWALDKRSSGDRVSQDQCKRYAALLENHIIPGLGKTNMADISSVVIRDFKIHLYKDKGLSGSTINKVLSALKFILEFADDENLIRQLPRISRAKIIPNRKGTLTHDEVKRLFAGIWEDQRVRVATLLSFTTGCRLSEILGIRLKDISSDHITLKGSWCYERRAYKDGLKNGMPSKTVSIPPTVSDAILDLIAESQYKTTDSYLIYSAIRGKPMEPRLVEKGFYTALKQIGISKEMRKERKIYFHSGRYFFNSILSDHGIAKHRIKEIMGHLSDSMPGHYYVPTQNSDIVSIQNSILE
jgi:integrase